MPFEGDGLAAEGGGAWRETVGGYEDWLRETRQRRVQPAVLAAGKHEAAGRPREARAKAKMPFKETRELEALPERIAALEAEQAGLNARLADPALYRGEPEELRKLNERLAALDKEIAQAMLRWEELEARSAGA